MNRFTKYIGLLLAMAMVALTSCSTEEEFSTEPGHALFLSHDTISIDTVLVSVKSTTREFRIYNHSSAAFRFSATLAGGASSCFSMNIDGCSSAYADDIEILPGDSLYGFVSVTPRESHIQPGQPLTVVRDSILLVPENGFTSCIHLNATVQNAVFLKKKTITSDTNFTPDLPYVIYDTLRVAEGATLTLTPGTTLLFHNRAGLDIHGRLIACGKPDSMVTFRTDRLDRLFSNLPYDLLSGQWNGIDIASDSYDNTLDYCDIHGALHGITASSGSNSQPKFTLTNSIIHNIEGECIKASNCSISVANSQITNAKTYCVDLTGGTASFEFCTIANCYLWSSNSGAVRISDNSDWNNSDGNVTAAHAAFNGCILTASGSWGLATCFATGNIDSVSTASDCLVMNSLVLMRDTTTVRSENTVFENTGSDIYGSANFIPRAENSYESVFRLDSISRACSLVSDPLLTGKWPLDLAGTARPALCASAGCYQFVPKP